ncbi:MAG: 1,4-dihydroxy-2-naphthoate polyprenyltransferase [Solirubrobacterales bacterium]
MGALRIWAMAARPRTLPAALAPVVVGSAAAWHALQEGAGVFRDVSQTVVGEPASASIVVASGTDEFRWLAFAAALLGAIFIQIGTNLANDYSDAKRGADTVDRLGPVRVTASGLAAPRRVLVATALAFALATLCGLYLAFAVGPVLIAVGLVSIAAGILYTGGPRPYGYEGLGELFVFVFFGLVAVNGSYYVQLEEIDLAPLMLSIPIGLLSAAILVVNNVRDIDTDRRAGKRTLAVRLGRERTRSLYLAMIVLSYLTLPLVLLAGTEWAPALLALASAPVALKPIRAVRERTDGPSLNGALADTGALLGIFALLVAIPLAI